MTPREKILTRLIAQAKAFVDYVVYVFIGCRYSGLPHSGILYSGILNSGIPWC